MKKTTLVDTLKIIGPGVAVAATGVGAGDMIAAAVAGAKYGTVILWAAVLGALIKFILNEGIARWQLATGQTLLEGWIDKLGGRVSVFFAVYLILWSFIVAGALIVACGLAAHALIPQLSVSWWGIVHSIAAALLVYMGRYALFERLMKLFVAMMFSVVIICALMVIPDWATLLSSLFLPSFPVGSGKFLLGVIGGVGGSLTLLNYSYWIREKNWYGKDFKRHTNIDLGAAYGLISLFGIALMVISAGVHPEVITDSEMVLAVANQLGEVIGPLGKWIFLIGFWGAVFSSMLGVWQGVPYIFTDFMLIQKQKDDLSKPIEVNVNSIYYKGYLLYMAFPPMLLLLFDKPVWIVVIYAIIGALFMPFLAATLLYMNNRRDWVSEFKNQWYVNLLLLLSLVVFGYLCVVEILEQI